MPEIPRKTIGAFDAVPLPFEMRADKKMHSVVADYQKNIRDWRINHLPLRVGCAHPSLLNQVNQLNISEDTMSAHGGQYTLKIRKFIQTPLGHLAGSDFRNFCFDEVKNKLNFRVDPVALPILAAACVDVICAIFEWDRKWFGHAETTLWAEMQYELINKDRGRHTNDSGPVHRDNREIMQDDFSNRTYLFRSRFHPICYRNAATEDIENADLENEVCARRLRQVSLADGDIVLINDGARGSAHKSYRPTKKDGTQSNLFLKIMMIPVARKLIL